MERTVHLITGKGGTGKTTFALALGLGWAARGLRTLIVELGADGGLGRAAGVDLAETVALTERCTLMSLATQPALRSFLEAHLPSRRLARVASSSALLGSLFGAAPGTVEVAQLDAIERFASGGYDRVVIDGEASGHTLLWLELPRVFSGLGAGGVLGKRLAAMEALVHGPQLVVHVATLAQHVVETETRAIGRGLEKLDVARGALLATAEPMVDADVAAAVAAAIGTAAEEDLAFELAAQEHARALVALGADPSTGFSGLVTVPWLAEPSIAGLTTRGLDIIAQLEGP